MSKFIALPPEYLEKKFEESLVELEEFSDVPGMIEFTNSLINLRGDEKFHFLSKLVDYTFTNQVDKAKNVEIIKNAKKGISGSFLFNNSNIAFAMFQQLYSVIAYSCISELGRELNDDEINQIIHSNLVANLTIAQENFLNVSSINLDKTFFKQLKKVKFNKRYKKLDKVIHNGYWKYINVEKQSDSMLSYAFSMCANYLAACYAFEDGRVEAVPEDLIRGWVLTLNLFNMDLRPYVFR